MIGDLERAFGGEHGVCALLCVPVMTLRAWRGGLRVPTASAKRAVWLTWALLLHPERIQTVFDLQTWGRFRTRVKPAVKSGVFVPGKDDWSI